MQELKFIGQPAGDIFQNEKKTGYLRKLLISGGKYPKLMTVFSKSPEPLTKVNDKGLLEVSIELPEFVFAVQPASAADNV